MEERRRGWTWLYHKKYIERGKFYSVVFRNRSVWAVKNSDRKLWIWRQKEISKICLSHIFTLWSLKILSTKINQYTWIFSNQYYPLLCIIYPTNTYFKILWETLPTFLKVFCLSREHSCCKTEVVSLSIK